MVGHQAVRKDAHRHRLGRLFHHPLEGGIVAVVGEDLPAVIAAVEAVEDNAAGSFAGHAWAWPQEYQTAGSAVKNRTPSLFLATRMAAPRSHP
jgi:hypothetical protein